MVSHDLDILGRAACPASDLMSSSRPSPNCDQMFATAQQMAPVPPTDNNTTAHYSIILLLSFYKQNTIFREIGIHYLSEMIESFFLVESESEYYS